MALKAVLKPGDTLRVSKSFGTIGSAAIKKAPLVIVADNNNEPILAQEVLINKPLVRMINVLASIDGFLKQRLSNQKLISENARLTSRETQIEQKDFVPEVQVVKPDAEKVSGGVGGLLALGGLALLTLDPVQQALKDMFEGVSSMGKFVSGIAQSINSVFTFLNGNNEPEPQVPTTESKQSTPVPVAQPSPAPMVSEPTTETPAPMATPVESTIQPPAAVAQEKPAVSVPVVSSSNKATPAPMTNVGVGAGLAMTAFSNAVQQAAPSKSASAPTTAVVSKPNETKAISASPAAIKSNNAVATEIGNIPKNNIVALGHFLASKGAEKSKMEHPALSGRVGKHSKNSRHYRGMAIDVNFPGPNEPAILDALEPQLRAAGYNTIWRKPGHMTHMHVSVGSQEGGSYGDANSTMATVAETVEKTVTSGIESIGKILGVLGSAIIKPGIPKDDLPKIIGQASRELNTDIAVSKTKKPVSLPKAKTPPRINKSDSGATQNPASSDDKNSVYYYLQRFGYSDLSKPEATLAR